MRHRYTGMIKTISFLLLFSVQSAFSQQSAIIIDGEFSDWDGVSPVYVDPSQDNQGNAVDFGELRISNDEKNLFIMVDLGHEIIIQENNQVQLYIDSDNDPGTGFSINGIGAELVWNFGQRSGRFYHNTGSTIVFQGAIGLVTTPTVSSPRFEIALARSAFPNNLAPLFPSPIFKIQLLDGQEPSDFLPNQGDTVSYSFDDSIQAPQITNSITKKQDDHLRILSYNVQVDGIFQEPRRSAYEAILGTIYPDIIGFTEIYQHNAEEIEQLIVSMMPARAGVSWHASKIDPDIAAVGQYPISGSYAIGSNGAFVFDLRPDYNSDLLLIVAHTPCCAANDDARQYEIDEIMAFVRDAKTTGDRIELEPNTPIVIVGDMNLVGDSQQLNTLLTGDIQNTGQFGSPFAPDWDGTFLSDLLPIHIGSPFTFTWYSETSSFSPGRLDFIIFSDTVLNPENGFVLFTPALTQDSLDRYDLTNSYATTASDHLPIVGDFSFNIINEVDVAGEIGPPRGFNLQQNYPNPSRRSTIIVFDLAASANIELSVFNSLGRLTRRLVSQSMPQGRHEIMWDGRDDLSRKVASGRYFYELKVNGEIARKKLVLIE